MTYHVYDGDRWWSASDEAEALKFAGNAIDAARDQCDPEWPAWVEDIHIIIGPGDMDDEAKGDADSVFVATMTEVECQAGVVGTYCNFAMMPTAHTGEKA